MANRKLVPVMRGICEAYDNAQNWPTRRSILSIVAGKMSFAQVRLFLPDITRYRFVSARYHAAQSGAGVPIRDVPPTVTRFEPEQVEHFVDFLVSDHVCTDVPFGERTLTLSDGTRLQLASA